MVEKRTRGIGASQRLVGFDCAEGVECGGSSLCPGDEEENEGSENNRDASDVERHVVGTSTVTDPT